MTMGRSYKEALRESEKRADNKKFVYVLCYDADGYRANKINLFYANTI